MITRPLALLLPLAALLAPAADADDVALLRYEVTSKKQPVGLTLHVANPGPELVGGLTGSDPKVYAAAGKKPLRFAFAADWDGDGGDELVLVRELTKKKGRLDLRVCRQPSQGKGVKTLASTRKKNELGKQTDDGRVAALGAIDLDGDGRDELLIAREFDDGHHALEVRSLPAKKKKKALGPPIVSDPNFGPTAPGTIVALCGIDRDGAPPEEIAALFRAGDGTTSLAVFSPPTTLGGDTGAPLAVDPDVAPGGQVPIALGRLDVDGDDAAELLVLSGVDSAAQRLDAFDAGFSGDLGDPEAVDDQLEVPGFDYPILFAAGVRPTPPPPPPTTPSDVPYPGYPANPWTLDLVRVVSLGDAVQILTKEDVTKVSIDPSPDGGLDIVFRDGKKLPITLPPGAPGPVAFPVNWPILVPFPETGPVQGVLMISFPPEGLQPDPTSLEAPPAPILGSAPLLGQLYGGHAFPFNGIVLTQG